MPGDAPPADQHSLPTDRRAVGGRLAWNVADQVVSSGSSAVLSLLLAHHLGARAFGGYAVGYGIYSFGVGLCVNAGTSALQVRFADRSAAVFRDAAAQAQGTVMAIGLVLGLCTAAGGAVIGGPFGHTLLCTGAALPSLMLVDAWRTVLKASGRPRDALVLDTVFALGQAAGLACLLWSDRLDAGNAVLVWGMAATVSTVVGIGLAQVTPRLRSAWSWVHGHRDLSAILVADYLLVLGAVQVTQVVLASVGGVPVTGALRGALILLGPLNILSFGAFGFAVPELVRQRPRGIGPMRRTAFGISGGLVLAGLAWGGLLLLIPDSAGRFLLGDTWAITKPTLLPSVLAVCGQFATFGPGSLAMVLSRPRIGLHIAMGLAPLIIGLSVLGVLTGGAEGAAWGLAAAQWSVVPVWGWIVVRMR